jgi:mono/diheme cytochrome c family protein
LKTSSLGIFVLLLASCRQPMANQPKVQPLQASSFFADGRSARPVPAGTVPRGHLNEDSALYTGKVNGEFVEALPIPLTRALVERGRQRYDIYCAPCHGKTGDGQGIVVIRGFQRGPASFHIDRLREAPVGSFFDVVTNGFGAMQDYAAVTTVEDRWAIVAYVRALQLSQKASIEDVPAGERTTLERQ